MIIDTHVHLPAVSQQRTYEQAKRIMLEDLDRHDVDYAILIPDNLPGSPIGDVATCLRLLEGEPRLFLLGTIDIQRQGQEWLDTLETLLARRAIVGMKIFPGHDPIYPTDPRLYPVYDLCQAYHAPMVIHTGWNSGHPEVAVYNDPRYIVEIARAYPALSLVIAHYFWPEVEYCYEVTHGVPNIYYDTSGLADEEVIAATGLERIRTVLINTLQEGPERVVFGTDYAMCDRQRHIELIRSLPISAQVREQIFWRNAVQLFQLNIAPGPSAIS
jgi:predicted TIM-barrel fold metal-dependent hydrolase